MRPLKVVVLDDEYGTRAFLSAAFAAEGHECVSFARAKEAEEYLSHQPVDLAMVDVYLGAENGIDLLHRLRDLQPDLYPVVMTAHASLDTAARSVAEGAVDYVSKPIDMQSIRILCDSVRKMRSERATATPDAEVRASSGSAMVGKSPLMLEVFKTVGRVASSDVPVLITGPSGVGKELVARAIHEHSKRASQPFVAVNCGSFTESLLDTELFGHEKGAFTGADRARRGVIEASSGGSLFLDEISETTPTFQVKLLRVLQEQKVRRVGSSALTPVDVRIITASNRDLHEQIRNGQFREDLFYRVSVVHIAVPPLEQRKEDIPLLVHHFLSQFNTKNQRNVHIDSAAVNHLKERRWPGNVRELENLVTRLAILSPTGHISAAEIDAEDASGVGMANEGETSADTLQDLAGIERKHIIRVMAETGGNRSEAARRLGIERKTLYKKAQRLGIDLREFDKT